jgi:hypothetical protein
VYFALPVHKQAEYDLGIARQELAQAQAVLPGMESLAANLETPRSKTFNLTWLCILGGLGLILFLAGLIGGSGGNIFWGIVALAAGAWVYFLAPVRRRSKGDKARTSAAAMRAQIDAILTHITELEIRAIDPNTTQGS